MWNRFRCINKEDLGAQSDVYIFHIGAFGNFKIILLKKSSLQIIIINLKEIGRKKSSRFNYICTIMMLMGTATAHLHIISK